jgi:hypothetical protein
MTNNLIKRSHSTNDWHVQAIISDIQTAFDNVVKVVSDAIRDLERLLAEIDDETIAKAKNQLSCGDLPSALKTLKYWQREMEADIEADAEEQAALEAKLDAEHAAAEAA